MSVIDYGTVWEFIRQGFLLLSTILANLGFGESGGKVMATLLIAAFFYLSGVFKKTRLVVGVSLALAIVLLSILHVV
ncbi:MAG: hypothetical protein QXU58_00465 [Pyrobaculum sp.]